MAPPAITFSPPVVIVAPPTPVRAPVTVAVPLTCSVPDDVSDVTMALPVYVWHSNRDNRRQAGNRW